MLELGLHEIPYRAVEARKGPVGIEPAPDDIGGLRPVLPYRCPCFYPCPYLCLCPVYPVSSPRLAPALRSRLHRGTYQDQRLSEAYHSANEVAVSCSFTLNNSTPAGSSAAIARAKSSTIFSQVGWYGVTMIFV